MTEDIEELIKNLESKDATVRKEAAKRLGEATEHGLDISSAVPVMLKLLSSEGASDILYDYLYTNPEEMSDYEKYLDIYEAYLALENFAKKNAGFLLKEIEKAKIDKSLFWVKNLIKDANADEVIQLKCDICNETAANIEITQNGDKLELKIETILGISTMYFNENDKNSVIDFIDKIQTKEGRKEFFKDYASDYDPAASNYVPNWVEIGTYTVELAFACLVCNKIYCKKEWKGIHETFDEGFYDETLATCPQGHEVCLDD